MATYAIKYKYPSTAKGEPVWRHDGYMEIVANSAREAQEIFALEALPEWSVWETTLIK